LPPTAPHSYLTKLQSFSATRMNLDKLKEAARKYEQREEWRRAIDVYLQAIREAEEKGGEGTQDPALYNRVGDLELKAGDSLAALRAYEQAAELYADQGFFNNSIALCGKILRVNPSRTDTYLRLAQLHARKNFVGEAKKNLVEYLERMDGVGRLDEAFTALKLFADQFSANPDIRLMLVELLRASSRTEEAKEQLEKLAGELEARGDAKGARRTRERLNTIGDERMPGDLVFLDTGIHPVRAATAKPPKPVEGLVSSAAEELVADPTRLLLDTGQHGAASLDAGAAAGDALSMQGTPMEGAGFNWGDEIAQVQELDDLITSDSAGPSRGARVSDEMPMLDLEEGALGPDVDLESGPPTNWLAEGPGEAALAGDSPEAVEASEFDDIDALPPPEGFEVPPPAGGREGGGAADLMMLQLEDKLAGSDPSLAVAPGTALLERARQLLDAGQREGGIRALEEALTSLEAEGRWDEALTACADLVRLEPTQIGRYQKQVEVAYLAGQRPALVVAYLELADALVRAGAADHASHVYRRVIEHDASNEAARSALSVLEGAAALDAVPGPPGAEPEDRPEEYVDLGALILDEAAPRDTRMKVGRSQPVEDEDQAFREALADFKRGIEANLDAEDFQAHYDLGIAFKEMGLVDEAIAEFQKALRSPEGRLKTSEQLGIAFFEKGQHAIAEAVLRRAVDSLPGADDEKIGLLYWLGRALEDQQRGGEALPLYQRALAVDIRFLDLGERVQRIAREGRP